MSGKQNNRVNKTRNRKGDDYVTKHDKTSSIKIRSKESEEDKMEKGKKGASRNNRRRGDSQCTVDGHSNNDYSWYNTLPELTEPATRFPFSRPLGTTLDWKNYTNNADTDSEVTSGLYGVSPFLKTSVPGIMTLHWTPTVGVSEGGNSPINVTAREIYSFVRHANSGAANYDSTDLMLYLLALDSIYSMYIAATRVYGLSNMYISTNRYMPKALIESLGWDFDAIISNLAQFRWAINNIAYKISSFNVPNFMSYYLRHMWMNQSVFTDKNSTKAQMYAYVQDYCYQFQNNIYESNYAGLNLIEVGDLTFTPDSWLEFMNGLINPLLASEDFGIMSGDILKAFGAGNLFSVAPITTDYIVVPGYNPEVLTQIQNACVTGTPVIGDIVSRQFGSETIKVTNNVVQIVDEHTAEGYLYSRPGFVASGAKPFQLQCMRSTMIDRLVTSDEEIPSHEFVMISTRMLNKPDLISVTSLSGLPGIMVTWSDGETCSTEVMTGIVIVNTDNLGDTTSTAIDEAGLLFVDSSEETFRATDSLPYIISKFDWCPTLPIHMVRKVDGEPGQKVTETAFCGYFQDTCNYTLMGTNDLTKLHEAAIMSMFYVPQTGSYTRKPTGK